MYQSDSSHARGMSIINKNAIQKLFKLTFSALKAGKLRLCFGAYIDVLSRELIPHDLNVDQLAETIQVEEVDNECLLSEYPDLADVNINRVSEYKRLNICCGERVLDGYDNTDIRKVDPRVMVFDHTEPWALESESYDEVFARHCLEHFSLKQARFVASETYRVLRPGGVVYVVVPNLEYINWNINDLDPLKRKLLMAFYYGYQDDAYEKWDFCPRYDSHKWGYTSGTLSSLLTHAGFTNVRNLTGNPNSREFKAKHWGGGLTNSGSTAHHLEMIARKLGGRQDVYQTRFRG